MLKQLSIAVIALLFFALAPHAEEVDLGIEYTRPMLDADLGVIVTIVLDDPGGDALKRFTSERVGQQIFVYVADKLVFAPTVTEPMIYGFIDIGGDTMEWSEAQQISNYLKSVGELTLADRLR